MLPECQFNIMYHICWTWSSGKWLPWPSNPFFPQSKHPFHIALFIKVSTTDKFYQTSNKFYSIYKAISRPLPQVVKAISNFQPVLIHGKLNLLSSFVSMIFTPTKHLYSAIMLPPRGENGLNPSLSKSVQSYILTHCVDSWPWIHTQTFPTVFKANTAQPLRLPAVAPCLCTSPVKSEADLHGKNNPTYIGPFWKSWSYPGKGSSETLFRKCPINQIFHTEKK